ncbi:sulfite oxidation cytochrome c subunit [Pandoraea terrae]|uniref:Sulfite oxidation cytochrome c subunit n=1 Tax=Pandoraea terrae TaxID=1537710 RepID=A0A5E4Y1M8_9BURK|nr:c-type cytochrome [Pandoraea terrae]VVE42536.1 sulfite oxidation cytochrome c subunit [Pandoraea terrae]
MKYAVIASLLMTSLSLAHAADATKAKEIMSKSDCAACHSVDQKMVGPSFHEIAAKYKGDKSAEDKLIKKVKSGGSGAWGPVPMPAHPQLSDADTKTLVDWVLADASAK